MKKLIIVLSVAALTYLGLVHIEHENELFAYREGCHDTIRDAAQRDVIELTDVIVNAYCEALSSRYVNKKQ